MLKRKMYGQLADWRTSEKKKVLILLGARQTGKTYTIRQFARDNYRHFIEVNFIEDEENGRFLSGASSAAELISRLSLIAGHSIEPGTLIFFDEVQHLGHDIVTLSKFLLDDGRFDIILSGSLLGTVLEGITSFPVGYAKVFRMFPLDFEEFCWAMGVGGDILDQVRAAYRNKRPLEQTMHDRLIKLYRYYICIGGMPESVQSVVDHNLDLGEARVVGTDIIEQYRYDIIKYAEDVRPHILSIFNAIPGQLSKVNKRFMLQSVKKGARYEALKSNFSWLTEAGVALPAYLVTEPKRPLERTEASSRFKLYSSDCGLLLSQYSLASARDIIAGAGDANYGAVYENVIAQELASAGFPLFYYNNNRKGEVDFLIETSRGDVVPIEVKSGKDYKLHSALNNLLKTDGYGIDFAYVMSEYNVSASQREGKTVYYLPLYMSLCLREELEGAFGHMFLERVTFGED